MSADNGIYILKTRKPDSTDVEYRVACVRGIDCCFEACDYPEDKPIVNFANLLFAFGDSPIYDRQEAIEAAFKLEEEETLLEYGISSINIPDFDFPVEIES